MKVTRYKFKKGFAGTATGKKIDLGEASPYISVSAPMGHFGFDVIDDSLRLRYSCNLSDEDAQNLERELHLYNVNRRKVVRDKKRRGW